MVYELAYCFGRVAPFYSLALVILVVILFLKLFKTPNKKTYIRPWKFLFTAVLVYVLEEIITVLHMANVIQAPKILFPLFEMVIITIFIYVLLLYKECIKKENAKKKK